MSCMPFNIIYFGNLGRFQGVDLLCAQMERLGSDCRYQFTIVGDGTESDLVKELANRHSNIRYLGSVPLTSRDEIFASAHMSIVSLVKGMVGTCVPSKIYFSLGNSVPLLCFVENGSEPFLICSEYNCGWVLDFECEGALEQFLCELTWEELEAKTVGAKAASREVSNATEAVESMKKVIDAVLEI